MRRRTVGVSRRTVFMSRRTVGVSRRTASVSRRTVFMRRRKPSASSLQGLFLPLKPSRVRAAVGAREDNFIFGAFSRESS